MCASPTVSSSHAHAYRTVMLCTLNPHNAVCQLHLNKTGKIKVGSTTPKKASFVLGTGFPRRGRGSVEHKLQWKVVRHAGLQAPQTRGIRMCMWIRPQGHPGRRSLRRVPGRSTAWGTGSTAMRRAQGAAGVTSLCSPFTHLTKASRGVQLF